MKWGSRTYLVVSGLWEDAQIEDDAADESNAVPRRDVQRNRLRLLDAARALLAEDAQVSMAAISEGAGLGRNTIYRHFPTRKALVEAVRAQSSDEGLGASTRGDERDHLRPAGELANVSPTPMSVWDVLNKVAPFQLGLQIVAEAQRLPGITTAAIYLVDLDGRVLVRWAGPQSFPKQLPIELAIGQEIDRQAVPRVRADIQRAMPGTAVEPLDLRGRAIGVLLAVGGAPAGLRELAQEAAAALIVAEHYTDLPARVRRTRPVSPAAELQQLLLPPRIARIGGAMIAGNVLPGYRIGGDWFDYTDDPEHAWLGILDMQGKGLRSAASAAAILAAFKAARRQDGATPASATHLMHDTLLQLSDTAPTAATTIATWNSATTLLHWVTCGHTLPLLTDNQGHLKTLGEPDQPKLGAKDFPKTLRIRSQRIRPDHRVIFASDGITARTNKDGKPFGTAGIARALKTDPGNSAATTLKSIQDAAIAHSEEPLTDDATLMVLCATAHEPNTPRPR